MKRRIYLRLTLLVGFFCHMSAAQHVSFESSFRASWYKKTLDACMYAWSELQELGHQDDLLPHEREIMLNVTLGRLVFADFCAQKMIQESKNGLGDDDIAYLLEVTSQLHDSFKQAAQNLSQDCAACVEHILKSVRTKIEALF